MEDGRKGDVHLPVFVQLSNVTGVGTVYGGGNVALLRDDEQLWEGRRQEVNKADVRLRGSEGERTRKGPVLVRPRIRQGGKD